MLKITRLLIITISLIMGLSLSLFAAEYYVATSGSNSNPGTSQAYPFATFANAFSIMQGGDTLYVADGVYNERLTNIPSGTPGDYTKIYAENNFQAEISGDTNGDGRGDLPASNYQNLMNISNASYIEICGLKIHHSKDRNNVVEINSSDHIILRKCAIYEAGWNPDGPIGGPDAVGGYIHDHPFVVTGTASDPSSDILIEECAFFGNGRYPVSLGVYSINSVFRRNIVRFDTGWDSTDIEPIAAISLYKGQNWILENNIVIDNYNPDFASSGGDAGIIVQSWSDLYPESSGNQILGNIVINLHGPTLSNNAWSGIVIETKRDPEPDNNLIENNAVIGVANQGYGIVLSRGVGISFKGNTVVYGQNGAWAAYYQSGASDSVNSLWKNNLAFNVSTAIAFKLWSGTYSNFSYNGYYNTASGLSGFICSAGCRTDNPELLYPVRLENNSSYKKAGESGVDIGATIVKCYESGVLTINNLWPFPNESEMKSIMCNSTYLASIGRIGANAPMWCTTDKTLTQYIWEYLGNPIPPEIYGSSGITGDLNSDGKVDITDIQACVNHVLGAQDYGAKADVNSDGAVNVIDVQAIVNEILS